MPQKLPFYSHHCEKKATKSAGEAWEAVMIDRPGLRLGGVVEDDLRALLVGGGGLNGLSASGRPAGVYGVRVELAGEGGGDMVQLII